MDVEARTIDSSSRFEQGLDINTPVLGSCHGFGVRSPMEFGSLRHGDGDPLWVVEPDRPAISEKVIHTWRMPTVGSVTLGQHSSGYTVIMESLGTYLVDVDRHMVELPRSADFAEVREALMWSTPAAIMSVSAGDLYVHAAAVQVGERAVLLTGPGRHGKTTLAAGFHAAGHRMLSDDSTRVTQRGGEWLVYPGPAVIRLRHDAAPALALNGVREWFRTGEKLGLAIDSDLRGDGNPIPLGGIIALEWGDDSERSEVRPEIGLAAMWKQSFYLPDDSSRAACFTALADLASAIPITGLRRRRDWSALPDTVEQIAGIHE
jgi:hypothetical protein